MKCFKIANPSGSSPGRKERVHTFQKGWRLAGKPRSPGCASGPQSCPARPVRSAATAAPAAAGGWGAPARCRVGVRAGAPTGQPPQPRLPRPRVPSLSSQQSETGSVQPRAPHHPYLEGIPLEDTDVSKEIKADRKEVQAQEAGSKDKENILERDKSLLLNKC